MAESFMINNLPESLILHTLSFLKTKEAVGTSLVSHGWKHLWTLVPCLDLDASDFNDTKKFEDFVNEAMLLRRTKHLDTFRLTWEFCHDDKIPTIHKWICQFIKFRPKILEIRISRVEEMQFPSCVFTCATLERILLSVDSKSIPELINPKALNLPSLKSLHLGYLRVHDEFINRIVSACPLLEELVFDSCCLEISKISSVTLKKLKIEHCDFSTGIRISAPRLVHFWCEGALWLDSFEYLPAFKEAHVESAYYYPEFKLHNGLNSATQLYFRGNCVQEILREKYCELFRNLKSLYFEGPGDDWDDELITSFLRLAPNIEKLEMVFKGGELIMAEDGVADIQQFFF